MCVRCCLNSCVSVRCSLLCPLPLWYIIEPILAAKAAQEQKEEEERAKIAAASAAEAPEKEVGGGAAMDVVAADDDDEGKDGNATEAAAKASEGEAKEGQEAPTTQEEGGGGGEESKAAPAAAPPAIIKSSSSSLGRKTKLLHRILASIYGSTSVVLDMTIYQITISLIGGQQARVRMEGSGHIDVTADEAGLQEQISNVVKRIGDVVV